MTEHLDHIERSLDIAAPTRAQTPTWPRCCRRFRGHGRCFGKPTSSTAFDLTLDAVTQRYKRRPPPRPWTR
jgi:hypothetical protein